MQAGAFDDLSVPDPDRTGREADRLGELLSEARATAHSEDRTVAVTVGPGNAVLDIDLASQARRHDGAALGALIVETYEQAVDELAQEISARMADLGPAAQVATAMVGGQLPAMSELGRLGPAEPDLPDDLALAELSGGMDDLGPEERDFVRRYGAEDVLLEASERLEELRRNAERQMAAYGEVIQAMAELTGTAQAADGAIEATVGSGGRLLRLEIDDEVLRHGPSKVGPMVLTAIQQANGDLAMRMAEEAERIGGGGASRIREMVRSYAPRSDDDADERTGRGGGTGQGLGRGGFGDTETEGW